jgi:glycine/D-amino acid oxidase-like deaminating enzyme
MKTRRIVVVGGGWGGCAAAFAAARAGAEVTLCERTDMLLGTGLVGGIFRNNGRFTAAEEMTVLGSDVFLLMDACARHTNVAFPGHAHASLYDVYRMEPEIRRALEKEIGRAHV